MEVLIMYHLQETIRKVQQLPKVVLAIFAMELAKR